MHSQSIVALTLHNIRVRWGAKHSPLSLPEIGLDRNQGFLKHALALCISEPEQGHYAKVNARKQCQRQLNISPMSDYNRNWEMISGLLAQVISASQ